MADTAVPYPPSTTPQYDYAGARPNMRMWADLAGCEPATDTNYTDVVTFTEYGAGCAARGTCSSRCPASGTSPCANDQIPSPSPGQSPTQGLAPTPPRAAGTNPRANEQTRIPSPGQDPQNDQK